MFSKVFTLTTIILFLYFAWLMVLITLQYIPIRLDAAFLNIKFEEVQISYYPWAFFIHVYSSIFVLLFGFVQFFTFSKSSLKKVHRVVGKWYILIILLLSGPSGLVMGIHAVGGWSAQLAFVLLSVLWMVFTWCAWRYAVRKNWQKHQYFMWLSYALTLSAITLRLFKYILSNYTTIPHIESYQLVAWLGWTFNLVVAHFWFTYNRNFKS